MFKAIFDQPFGAWLNPNPKTKKKKKIQLIFFYNKTFSLKTFCNEFFFSNNFLTNFFSSSPQNLFLFKKKNHECVTLRLTLSSSSQTGQQFISRRECTWQLSPLYEISAKKYSQLEVFELTNMSVKLTIKEGQTFCD